MCPALAAMSVCLDALPRHLRGYGGSPHGGPTAGSAHPTEFHPDPTAARRPSGSNSSNKHLAQQLRYRTHPLGPTPTDLTDHCPGHSKTLQDCNRHHGRPAAPCVRHPADPARQPREPARELLPQVLPVPRPLVAAAVLRRRRCVAPAQDPLRLPQDRRLCARQDGGGADRRHPARPHHLAVRHAHPPPPRHCGEADAPES